MSSNLTKQSLLSGRRSLIFHSNLTQLKNNLNSLFKLNPTIPTIPIEASCSHLSLFYQSICLCLHDSIMCVCVSWWCAIASPHFFFAKATWVFLFSQPNYTLFQSVDDGVAQCLNQPSVDLWFFTKPKWVAHGVSHVIIVPLIGFALLREREIITTLWACRVFGTLW